MLKITESFLPFVRAFIRTFSACKFLLLTNMRGRSHVEFGFKLATGQFETNSHVKFGLKLAAGQFAKNSRIHMSNSASIWLQVSLRRIRTFSIRLQDGFKRIRANSHVLSLATRRFLTNSRPQFGCKITFLVLSFLIVLL